MSAPNRWLFRTVPSGSCTPSRSSCSAQFDRRRPPGNDSYSRLLQETRRQYSELWRTNDALRIRNGVIEAGPQLPPELIEELRQAVLSGDKGRIDILIREVREINAPSASALQQMADSYEYDAFTCWLEEVSARHKCPETA
jgi:hypothetical protein